VDICTEGEAVRRRFWAFLDVKFVSFDLEGTLVDDHFSYSVWNEGIPQLYAERHGLNPQEAKKIVLREYDLVGDDRLEWYDIGYWFKRFGLGDYRNLLKRYAENVRYYPDALEALARLKTKYPLMILTNSSHEFINYLAEKISQYFHQIFSATSDLRSLKRSGEPYLRVCKFLNLDPSSVIHIGDLLEDDYKAPKRVGVKACLLDRTSKTSHEEVVNNLVEFSERVLTRL
jgi:HAD superfamily hydrolase (TIGR01493 family)